MLGYTTFYVIISRISLVYLFPQCDVYNEKGDDFHHNDCKMDCEWWSFRSELEKSESLFRENCTLPFTFGRGFNFFHFHFYTTSLFHFSIHTPFRCMSITCNYPSRSVGWWHMSTVHTFHCRSDTMWSGRKGRLQKKHRHRRNVTCHQFFDYHDFHH